MSTLRLTIETRYHARIHIVILKWHLEENTNKTYMYRVNGKRNEAVGSTDGVYPRGSGTLVNPCHTLVGIASWI